MADETINKFHAGGYVALGVGGGVSDAGFAEATTADFNSAVHSDYPDAKFALKFTNATSAATGQSINVYAQKNNVIDTGSSTPAPDANFLNYYVGTFPIDTVITEQVQEFVAFDIPDDATYFIENQSGVTISSWDLRAKAWTKGPL